MTIGEIAGVRTGLVTARKKKSVSSARTYEYQLLNLKCIADEGYINKVYIETYETSEELKDNYLTQMGDILVRLSSPYTAVLIDQSNLCGLVVPSHFAIIRVDRQHALPEYVFWVLRRDKNKITMMQNSSGSTAFGTISSGLISSLPSGIATVFPLSAKKRLRKGIVNGASGWVIILRLKKRLICTLTAAVILPRCQKTATQSFSSPLPPSSSPRSNVRPQP